MKKISRLFFIFLIFLNSGCSWVAFADYSFNSHDYGCSQRLRVEIKQEEQRLDKELVGLSREDVIVRLGKPKPKNIKHGLSYVVNRDCFGKTCETKLTDEAWYYDYEKKVPSCGGYSYSIIIYFIDGKVVRVG